jgi:hypothetical protein
MSDNPFSTDDDSTDTLQRYRITVPNPKAWFHMGEPSDLGYKGVSLGADDHAFLSVKGSTLTQAKGQVFHMAWLDWMQSSGGDMTLSTGGNQMMVSKRQLILAAGAGYSPDLQLENGIDLPKAYFNPYDYRQIIDPCRNGVRNFDDDMRDGYNSFLDLSGLPIPAGAAVGAAAKLEGLARAKAALLALLCGIQPPPTENSESIEQFSRKHGGLWGLISRVRHVTDGLERWMSRPETLPLVGPLIDVTKSLQLAMQGATTAASTLGSLPVLLGFQSSPDGSKGGIVAEYGREMDEASGKNAMIEHGTGARSWADQGRAVAELTGTGFQHLLRPIANRVRALSYALASVRNGLDAIANLVGVPRTSSLALIGKDGVSIVSPKRVFGYAADGFHFVTADAVASVPDKWDIIAKIQEAGDALMALIKKPDPKPVPVPGFHVRSQGDIDLRSQADINLWAIDGESRARVTSGYASELSAIQHAGVSARTGTAEVLGKEVVVGAMVARAKLGILVVATSTALDSATKAFATALQEYVASRKTKNDAAEALRMLTLDPLYRIDPAKVAEATTGRAKVLALEVECKAKLAAAQALQVVRDAAFDAYKVALDAAPLESKLATAMDWDKKQVQAIAEKIEMGAADKVGVFGDKVLVESTTSITLQTQPVVPVPVALGTVKVESNQVEINVGTGMFTVTVGLNGVTISSKAGHTIKLDDTGATLQAVGGTKIALTPAGLDLSGQITNVTGEMINLG